MMEDVKNVIDTFNLVTDVSTFFTDGETYRRLVCLFEQEGFAFHAFLAHAAYTLYIFTKGKVQLFRK